MDGQQCSFWIVWLSLYSPAMHTMLFFWWWSCELTFTNVRDTFSFFDITLGFFEISWNIIHLALGVILVNWLFLEGSVVLNCLWLYTICLTVDSRSLRLFGNSFVTFSGLLFWSSSEIMFVWAMIPFHMSACEDQTWIIHTQDSGFLNKKKIAA